MKSKYKTLAYNTGIFAIGNILVKIISLFLMPLYTIVLTTEQYGIAELLNNSIEIVLPVATLCIIDALYRYSIDEDSDHSTLLINSILIIVIGDAIVGIICFICFLLFGFTYALYFFLLYITITFYKVTCQFARGLGHVKRYAAYGIINASVLVISNLIFLVYLEGGVSAYILSYAISYGIAGIIAFFASKEYCFLKPDHFCALELKEMLRYSLPGVPNMLSWWVNTASDRYIILMFHGAGLAGLYTAASKLPAMINLVTSIFQQAWQYSTATEIGSTDRKAFFSNVFRLYTYISLLVCCGLIIFNKLICRILLQADFYSAWRYVPLLLLAATIGCIATFFVPFYNAMKNNKMEMISTVIGAVSNIVLNFALIPKFAGFGAAIATAVSYLVIMVIRMVDISRIIEIDINYGRFIVQFIVLGVSVISGCFEGTHAVIIPSLCFAILIISDWNLIKIVNSYFNRQRTGK